MKGGPVMKFDNLKIKLSETLWHICFASSGLTAFGCLSTHAAELIGVKESYTPATEPLFDSGSASSSSNNFATSSGFAISQTASILARPRVNSNGDSYARISSEGYSTNFSFKVEYESNFLIDMSMAYNYTAPTATYPIYGRNGKNYTSAVYLIDKTNNRYILNYYTDPLASTYTRENSSDTFSRQFQYRLQPGIEYSFIGSSRSHVTAGIPTYGSRYGSGMSLDTNTIVSARIEPLIDKLGFTTDHVELGYIEAGMSPELLRRIDSFENAVKAKYPNAVFSKESGFRPPAYQDHLYEISKIYRQMLAFEGVDSSLANVNGRKRPHLVATDPTSLSSKHLELITQVNNEIDTHSLVHSSNRNYLDNGLYVPIVGKTSLHSKGEAVDISIPGIDKSEINNLAIANGLKPHPTDRVHYTLNSSYEKKTVQIRGDSPVLLLVTDSQGRQIGFNPETLEYVNDFGREGFYSGTGTEPQIIEIDVDESELGELTVTGLGTGEGPFTITARMRGEVFDGQYEYEEVLLSGQAKYREELAEVSFTPIVPEPTSILILGMSISVCLVHRRQS